jgi:aspartate racemase
MVEDPGGRVSGLRTPQQALPATGQLVAAKEIAAPEEYAMQKADVELRLVKLWETTLRVQPIGIDQNFFEMGGDSLLAARLFAQIGKAFQMDLPLATLLEAPTIRQLAAKIRSGKSRSPDSCLVAIQPKGTKPPLFCVHGHMGEIFYCWNLAHCMGPDQPLFGLRAKGLGGELPHHTVEEMAAHYLREIRAMQACGPYFLSGYCLGGMVAFEMARLLEHEGEEVALLMLFNAPAPGGLEGWPLRWSYLSKRVGHELGKLRTLRTREKLVILGHKTLALASLVIGNFKAAVWGALPASITSREGRERQRWLSVADINVAAAKAYRPGAYAGQITLFSTKELASLYAIDAEAGWASLAAGGVELYTVAGDNNSMFDARFIDGLTQKLKSCIANANMSTAVHCDSASQPKQRNATFPAPTTAAPTYSGSGDKC